MGRSESEQVAAAERAARQRNPENTRSREQAQGKVTAGGPLGMTVTLDHKGEHWPHDHDTQPKPR
jgi:hypothetical protein